MNKLKKMRNKAGYSQSQFANLAGINIGTLRHYEQGSKNFDHARIDTILKTCLTLDCKFRDVIENEEYIQLFEDYVKKEESQ